MNWKKARYSGFKIGDIVKTKTHSAHYKIYDIRTTEQGKRELYLEFENGGKTYTSYPETDFVLINVTNR